MATVYEHFGSFSGIVAEARKHQGLFPLAQPGTETQQKVRDVLGWCDRPEAPGEVRVERRWEKDGLSGQEISWSVGYGPRTEAWVFRPAQVERPLPAVLALHDHGEFKYYGKEKIAEGPEPPEDTLVRYREGFYGGRAWVNALAREGFLVLVHDTFLWGSRRFPLAEMKDALGNPAVPPDELIRAWREARTPPDVAEYNYIASLHEHTVSKCLNLLGTGLPGVVGHEDRIALSYLLSRPDVQPNNVACMGLSGGGNRAGMLRATAQGLKAAVVVGLMSTYEELLHRVTNHTWMLFPFGWARHGDWTDLVACQAPAALLVQYDLDDELFTEIGMRDAHMRLAGHYQSVGHPEAYTGQFYPGPHKFDLRMQTAAFAWLKEQLAERE